MIVREFYLTRSDGVKLFKTYSDSNKKIKKVGTDDKYIVAIDVESANWTYVETDEEIQPDPEL
ncbi:MAG: hypothetical protein IKU29_11785 [Parabacteroides sp.]|nr:hypothetical protein [Parabacteroides sp.]